MQPSFWTRLGNYAALGFLFALLAFAAPVLIVIFLCLYAAGCTVAMVYLAGCYIPMWLRAWSNERRALKGK